MQRGLRLDQEKIRQLTQLANETAQGIKEEYKRNLDNGSWPNADNYRQAYNPQFPTILT